MTGTCLKIGLVLEGLGSGLWCVGSSGEAAWLPLLLGLAGAVPLARGWADAVFQGGDTDVSERERIPESA